MPLNRNSDACTLHKTTVTFIGNEQNMKHVHILYVSHGYAALRRVRKRAKIRNRYNQAPHLTQDNQWEIDNVTIRHHKRETRGQPISQQVTTRQKQTDVHKSIIKQDSYNI